MNITLEEYYYDDLIEDKRKEIIKILNRDCKPFIREFKNNLKNDDFIYRGVYYQEIDFYEKKKSRQDRRPLNTPEHTHKRLDDLFMKEFGWKARSEGVFCTNKRKQAFGFGEPHLFFPIGQYDYIYNEKIRDLYVHIKEKDTINSPDPNLLETIISSYKNNNLNKHLDNNGKSFEIVFRCKEYYIINPDYKSDILVYI